MLKIDLSGKLALVAGVADDQGFGWAITKSLAAAGAKIILAAWPPAFKILEMSLNRGKLNTALPEGKELSVEHIYPLDAVYDRREDAPEEIRTNKRYSALGDFSIQGLRKNIERDYGKDSLAVVVHSLANGPEVSKPLMQTSRTGYLAANSASAYSFVSMIQNLSPIMPKGGAFLALSYLAAHRAVPGYGGGMSSAKASLESDTKTLSYEAGREFGHRVNTISAGPLASRAARSIGFVDAMISYSEAHAPLQDSLKAADVGNTAAFLCSPLAAGITGSTVYVDKGMHVMGPDPDDESAL